jgi:hypothetical protein
MRKKMLLSSVLTAFMLAHVVVVVQSATITFLEMPMSEGISNPERGFYQPAETKTSSFSLLSNMQFTLNQAKQQNISLVLREWFLNNFLTTNISQTILNNIQADFNTIRNSGMKCIVRFAYTDDQNARPLDASKTQMLTHLRQLKPIMEANVDVIAVIQAGLIGAWGEWLE